MSDLFGRPSGEIQQQALFAPALPAVAQAVAPVNQVDAAAADEPEPYLPPPPPSWRKWPPAWHGETAADRRIARQYKADETEELT